MIRKEKRNDIDTFIQLYNWQLRILMLWTYNSIPGKRRKGFYNKMDELDQEKAEKLHYIVLYFYSFWWMMMSTLSTNLLAGN